MVRGREQRVSRGDFTFAWRLSQEQSSEAGHLEQAGYHPEKKKHVIELICKRT